MTSTGRTTRVVVVDDQDLVRDGLRAVLEAHPGLEVVGEAPDGETALRIVAATHPDVVMMDVRMPRRDGISATRALTAARHSPYVIVLTTFDLDQYVLAALQAGASGFLLKDASRDRIVDAVLRVAAGEALLAPTVTRRLVEHFVRTGSTEHPELLAHLTAREKDVLTLVASGLSNAEIAARLHLGESTVKSYVANILAKLGVRDRVQATVTAYDAGLVVPGQRMS